MEWEPKALEDTEIISFINIEEAHKLKLAPNVEFLLSLVKDKYNSF